MNPLPTVTLKPGRDKPLRAGHPWIFSGAVASPPSCTDGEAVDLLNADGQFLARACWNAQSQIVARVWSRQREPLDAAFFRRRLEAALAVRRAAGLEPRSDGPTTAFRLVNAESDQLPGIVVDVYGEYVSLELLLWLIL